MYLKTAENVESVHILVADASKPELSWNDFKELSAELTTYAHPGCVEICEARSHDAEVFILSNLVALVGDITAVNFSINESLADSLEEVTFVKWQPKEKTTGSEKRSRSKSKKTSAKKNKPETTVPVPHDTPKVLSSGTDDDDKIIPDSIADLIPDEKIVSMEDVLNDNRDCSESELMADAEITGAAIDRVLCGEVDGDTFDNVESDIESVREAKKDESETPAVNKEICNGHLETEEEISEYMKDEPRLQAEYELLHIKAEDVNFPAGTYVMYTQFDNLVKNAKKFKEFDASCKTFAGSIEFYNRAKYNLPKIFRLSSSGELVPAKK